MDALATDSRDNKLKSRTNMKALRFSRHGCLAWLCSMLQCAREHHQSESRPFPSRCKAFILRALVVGCPITFCVRDPRPKLMPVTIDRVRSRRSTVSFFMPQRTWNLSHIFCQPVHQIKQEVTSQSRQGALYCAESSHLCVCQIFHTNSWAAVQQKIEAEFPIWTIKTHDMWASLPAKLNAHEDRRTTNCTANQLGYSKMHS